MFPVTGIKLKFISLMALIPVIIYFTGCQESSKGPAIKIKNAWSRPVSIGEKADTSATHSDGQSEMKGMMDYNGVVYMTIYNHGGEADKLIGAESDVCERVELHQSMMEGDRMMMRKIDEGLKIPPMEKVEMRPGGYHLMLMGLKRSLKPGEEFRITLRFEKSGAQTVTAKVKL